MRRAIHRIAAGNGSEQSRSIMAIGSASRKAHRSNVQPCGMGSAVTQSAGRSSQAIDTETTAACSGCTDEAGSAQHTRQLLQAGCGELVYTEQRAAREDVTRTPQRRKCSGAFLWRSAAAGATASTSSSAGGSPSRGAAAAGSAAAAAGSAGAASRTSSDAAARRISRKTAEVEPSAERTEEIHRAGACQLGASTFSGPCEGPQIGQRHHRSSKGSALIQVRCLSTSATTKTAEALAVAAGRRVQHRVGHGLL